MHKIHQRKYFLFKRQHT